MAVDEPEAEAGLPAAAKARVEETAKRLVYNALTRRP